MGKISFKELVDKLEYFSVEDNTKKTIEAIREECREYIRYNGFECMDECLDPETDTAEYLAGEHPDWDMDCFLWSRINYQPLQFLCEDKWSGDLHFAELNIDFFGDYGSGVGIFNVTE